MTGLRSILVEDKVIFVCGVGGFFAQSTNGGKSFRRIDVGATATLHTVLRADRSLWCTGDQGGLPQRRRRQDLGADRGDQG